MINLSPEQSAKQLATLLAAPESAVLDFKRISAKHARILKTVKVAAHNAYRDVARGMIQ